MASMKKLWKFQTSDGLAVHPGHATDARGLRLRAECGYDWVYMGYEHGWLQISVAIQKLEMREQLSKMMGAA